MLNPDELRKHKQLNMLQSLLLVLSMAGLMGILGWLIGGELFAWFAVGLVVALYFSNPTISPRFVLNFYRCRPISRHATPRLYAVADELTKRAGLPVTPVLFQLPDGNVNAFAVGSQENPAIALSSGLLQRMDLTETAGILAHEISHIQHNDIHIMGFADTISRITHALSLTGQLLLILSLPLALLNLAQINWPLVLLLLVAPMFSSMLQLALSRTREYDADLGAAILLGDSAPLIRALQKIDYQQNRLLQQFFGFRRSTEPSTLRTHPHVHERIERLAMLTPRRVYRPLM